MSWEIAIVIASTAALAGGGALGVSIWYVRRFLQDYQKREQEGKRETVAFLRLSIEHMKALHAGTAKQIAVLEEHAKKLEGDLK